MSEFLDLKGDWEGVSGQQIHQSPFANAIQHFTEAVEVLRDTVARTSALQSARISAGPAVAQTVVLGGSVRGHLWNRLPRVHSMATTTAGPAFQLRTPTVVPVLRSAMTYQGLSQSQRGWLFAVTPKSFFCLRCNSKRSGRGLGQVCHQLAKTRPGRNSADSSEPNAPQNAQRKNRQTYRTSTDSGDTLTVEIFPAKCSARGPGTLLTIS